MAPALRLLPPHVFACTSSRYVVLLNLREDRYTCLPRDEFGVPLPAPLGLPAPRNTWYAGRIPARTLAARLPAFIVGCRRADHALENERLEVITNRVAARRGAARRSAEPDALRAVRLTAAFRGLRLLYPRPRRCTFDALALLEFLALHGCHPTWVFGVRADPFEAHCWVQMGPFILNDRTERVQRLTPIMAV